MKSLAMTIATIWRLSVPYFRSDDRWPGRILLAAVIAIELSLVAIQVILNQWYNRFYNTLQDHNWNAFVSAILFFCVIVAVYTILAVYQLYLNQWLQIRWRRWMTQTYLRQWLDSANHYRMQLLGDAADNPDQRIADDLQMFVQYTLTICIGILNSVVTLGSFVFILWRLSAEAPLTLFGVNYNIPGYLVWAALIYAVIGTTLTHLIGWKLIPLNFQQQRFEADFRFNLVRTRENAEQIAALGGEAAERERHLNRFSYVIGNWYGLMQRQKQLMFFTQSYTQASVIFPYIMVSPAYFSGAVQLGGLMQTASAFNSVQNALSYFVSSYRNIAEWRAIVARLSGFEEAIAAGRAAAVTPPAVEVISGASGAVAIDRLNVRLPKGEPIVVADSITFPAGGSVLVTGPSGSGKSTLFRAIAGIWPFGSGRVVIPKGAKVMLVPQRPYFPLSTLATTIAFPAEAGTFDDKQIAEVLAAVGLPQLIGRLGEEQHWNRMLSLGEQQRLAIARVLLQAPDYLFLDEATASLDEPAEAALYRMLRDRLKGTTIVSIGHRSTLAAFHSLRVEFTPDHSLYRVREVPLASAAE
ncbi:MAG TPA: ABC transporter ATP-binding protein/permease [Xanthobacteraceae bacterium]|nr:ABC transporter ATP-binding protein/permease [Xanthobacteraceae bacterium]